MAPALFFVRYQVAFLAFAIAAFAFASSYIESVIAPCGTSLALAQSRASWSESRRVVGWSSWPSGSHVISSWISSYGLRTILGRRVIRIS